MFNFLSNVFHRSHSAPAPSERSDGIKVQGDPAAGMHVLDRMKLDRPQVSVRPKVSASVTVVDVPNENATSDSVKRSPRTGHPNDNLNYLHYEGKGVYLQTGRERKVSVDAFSESEALDDLVLAGYDRDSIHIQVAAPEPATVDQIQSMRDHGDYIPEPMCKVDASYLISRYMEDDAAPPRCLLDFATERKIQISYYIGLKSLFYQFQSRLSREELMAVWLCHLSFDMKGDWQFSRFSEFVEYGRQLMNDSRFMKSWNEHHSFERFRGLSSDGQYRRRLYYTIPADKI